MMLHISGVKPNWLCKIGKITIIPPPGTAVAENFAMQKYSTKTIKVSKDGKGCPYIIRIVRLVMGMLSPCPIIWILTVAGIINLAKGPFEVFFSVAEIVTGIATALEMVENPVRPAADISFRLFLHFFHEKLLATKYIRKI